ncbi:MAG: hypothetical protein QXR24_06895 [Thermosphaera sp.]
MRRPRGNKVFRNPPVTLYPIYPLPREVFVLGRWGDLITLYFPLGAKRVLGLNGYLKIMEGDHHENVGDLNKSRVVTLYPIYPRGKFCGVYIHTNSTPHLYTPTYFGG